MSHMFHVHTDQQVELCKIFNKAEMIKSQLANYLLNSLVSKWNSSGTEF